MWTLVPSFCRPKLPDGVKGCFAPLPLLKLSTLN
jgi:hypothetical protein